MKNTKEKCSKCSKVLLDSQEKITFFSEIDNKNVSYHKECYGEVSEIDKKK